MNKIIKRDGQIVPFDLSKIADAINKAFAATAEIGISELYETSNTISQNVANALDTKYPEQVDIETIQDEVENALMEAGYQTTAKAYILYRAQREAARNRNTKLMKTLHEIMHRDSKDNDLKRNNANIDGNTAMGTMLLYGSESSKAYYADFMIEDDVQTAQKEGDIHIHDLDFYGLTTTCTQIDIERLFKNGFNTGHGGLREPNDIASYGALAAIALQANQNDQHGGQSIPNFDRAMAIGVQKTYKKLFVRHLEDIIDVLLSESVSVEPIIDAIEQDTGKLFSFNTFDDVYETIETKLEKILAVSDQTLYHAIEKAAEKAYRDTDKKTFQAMEAFIHNMNTMHSRAGAQVPFSSINYGTDTSPEGQMVIRNLLLTTMDGLGNGETPIFPIQVFRMKKGINFEPGEPNYELFKLALECSSKRMFPNFSFQDAPFNMKYLKPDDLRTEIAYMGCRTRVIANVNDPDREIAYSRGNLSFTTINLPRLAIDASDEKDFYVRLDKMLELVVKQLLQRFEIVAKKQVKNFPFLMGQGVWLDSDKLSQEDSIREVMKHGTLSIGFIGLAETLTQLYGAHHGESKESQKKGLEIIGYMRDFCDRKAAEHKLNFTLLATPAEGLSGRFVNIDKKKYGIIEGVTDKEYYTNSFHVPVAFPITACKKIMIEAPYHALTNAGHISYVELDGNIQNNLEAFEKIVKFMGECGMGYGAVNHPLDNDPVCGYSGVIDDECPACGRRETEDAPFERIRRVTGYLVGTLKRFNDAKQAEERDRIKHMNFAVNFNEKK